jgi:hypothetical protein
VYLAVISVTGPGLSASLACPETILAALFLRP